MITRIFFDANIILEWLNKDASGNEECLKCIEKSIETSCTLMVSPTTLAILYYFVSKKIKNKPMVKQKLQERMKLFEFTTEDAWTVTESFSSRFLDLEDALQYFSAASSSADAIVTYNEHHYINTRIPVYHPLTFLSLFE